jgi:hypothetical protein
MTIGQDMQRLSKIKQSCVINGRIMQYFCLKPFMGVSKIYFQKILKKNTQK